MLIGAEVTKGTQKLHSINGDAMFLGIIGGWETYIGRDYDTGKYLGYNAMTNIGYSSMNLPPDIDEVIATITSAFVKLWASSLVTAGIPKEKVYSHITFMPKAIYNFIQKVNPAAMTGSYLENSNFSRPSTAFSDSCVPGLSTYPQAGVLEEWRSELMNRGNPPWASCEGTAVYKGQISNMETYLGNLFNHGATLVNLYGWGVGDPDYLYRKATENVSAIAVYQKFMRGEALKEAPVLM
jgi:hypothetical protein